MECGQLYQQWDVYMGIPRDLSSDIVQMAKERELKKLLGLLFEILPESSDQLHQLLDIHSVSNVLANEFMSDVRTISSENATEQFSLLLEYLTFGRGATIVTVLALVGIRDLVHGLNFGKCIIGILKQLLKFDSWSDINRQVHLNELELFVVREPRYRKVNAEEMENKMQPSSEHEEESVALESEVALHSKNMKLPSHHRISSRLRKQQNESKELDDSGSDTSKKLLVVFREMRRTFHNVPDLVENFVADLTFFPLASQLTNSENVPKMEIKLCELCLLLSSILKDICFDDDQYREEKSSCMNLLLIFQELIDVLLDKMCQASCEYSDNKSLSIIGRSLLRIFISLTSKISSQIDGLLVLRNNKTPGSMLEQLVRCLCGMGGFSAVMNSYDRFNFFYDAVSSCLLYVEIVLSGVTSTPFRLSSALDATKFVLHEFGLELLELIILQLDEECLDEQSTFSAKQLLIVLMQFIERIIRLLKLLKARYIHHLTCNKRAHRHCISSMAYAHHHDVLGLPSSVFLNESNLQTSAIHTIGSPSNKSNYDICAIAAIDMALLSIFEKSSESTKHLILTTLSNSGLCCCIPVKYFTEVLLEKFQTRSEGLRQHILDLLTDSYLLDFGGTFIKIPESFATICCSTCFEECDTMNIHLRTVPINKMETSDSALSDSDSQASAGLTFSSRWSCLKLLLPHLCSVDDAIAKYFQERILYLVNESCPLLKYKLLYYIFLPILQEAERIFLPLTPDDDSVSEAYSPVILTNMNIMTVQYSLYVLPKLMEFSNSHELFVSSNGVLLLKNLFRVEDFQQAVLHVLRLFTFITDLRPTLDRPGFVASDPVSSEIKKHIGAELTVEVSSIADASLMCLINILFDESVKEPSFIQQLDITALQRISDIWYTASLLFANHTVFSQMFIEKNGTSLAQRLLFTSVKAFLRRSDIRTVNTQVRLDTKVAFNDYKDCVINEKFQEVRAWLTLVKAALSICICYARQCQNFGTQTLTIDYLLEELSKVVDEEMEVSTKGWGSYQLFCEVLLTCIDSQESKSDQNFFQHRLHSLDSGMVKCSGSKQKTFAMNYGNPFSQSSMEPGYEGDYETSSEVVKDDDNISNNSVLFSAERDKNFGCTYPELSRLILHVAVKLSCLNSSAKQTEKNVLLGAVVTVTSASKTSEILSDHVTADSLNSCVSHSTVDVHDSVSLSTEILDNQFLINAEPLDNCVLLKARTADEPASLDTNEMDNLKYASVDKMNNTVSGGTDRIAMSSFDTMANPVSLCIIKQLGSFGKTCRPLIIYLHRQNLIHAFISCYKESRGSDSMINREVLKILMDVFLQVARLGVSAKALSTFLSLFDEEENLDLLLSILNLLTCYMPVQPKYSLRMPVSRSLTQISVNDLELASLQPSQSLEVNMTSPQTFLESIQLSFPLINPPPVTSSPEGTAGNVVVAAVKTALREMIWPPGKISGKLSVAFWIMVENSISTDANLKRRRSCLESRGQKRKNICRSLCEDKLRSETSQLSHVVAIGNLELMLEVWIKHRKRGLIFRIVSRLEGFESILSQEFLPLKLQKNKWHHLVLTYEQSIKDIKTMSRVTVYLDGSNDSAVTLKWIPKAQQLTKSAVTSCSYLHLGHCNSQTNGNSVYYQMGNLFLFQDILLTDWMCFFLYCLGPDCSSLSCCDSSELSPMSMQSIHAILLSNGKLKQDFKMESEFKSLNIMRKSLLLVYSSIYPNIFSFIRNSAMETSKLDMKKKNGRLLQQSPATSELSSQLMCIRVRPVADLDPLVNQETLSSINQLGGVKVFLYLYAKVVERCTLEKDQAQALQVLFGLVQADETLFQEFIQVDGYAMIVKIFLTLRSVIGFETMKVLLDACLTKSILSYRCMFKSYLLDTDNSSLIRDVRIITDIIFAWTVWNKTTDDVWLLGFRAIHSLIRQENFHCQFNIKALLAAGAVDKLLNICLERLQLSCPSLSLPFCQVYLSIIRDLIGPLPDVHHVIQICDFLLLTHPAANTFVYHNPTTFYFRNKWIAGERPVPFSYEGSKVIIGGFPDNQNSQMAADVAKLIDKDEKPRVATSESLEILSSALSVNKNTLVPGKLLNQSDSGLTDAEIADSKRADTWQPDTTRIPESIFMADAEVSDTSESMNGTVIYIRAAASGTTSTRMLDCHVSDNQMAGADGISNDTDDSTTPSSNISADHSKTFKVKLDQEFKTPDVDLVDFPLSSFAAIQDGRSPGSSVFGSLDMQVFQKEVISLGEVTGSDSLPDDDDLGLLSDDQSTVTDIAGNSSKMQDLKQILNHQALNTFDSSSEVQAFGDSVDSSTIFNSVEKEDEGLVCIVIGLLELLSDLLHNLKETDNSARDLDNIFNVVLKPQVLVVMAHHMTSRVRTAVLKVLKCYLKLTNNNRKDSFVKLQIFHLLANQLHQHTVEWSIVEESLSILIGQMVPLDRIAMLDLPIGIPHLYQMSIVLLMAITENSVSDFKLCHLLLSVLQKVFVSFFDVSQVMLENGLAEVLCNTIHRLSLCQEIDYPVATTATDADRQIVKIDIRTLFCCIAQKTFCTTGNSSFLQFEDTLILLKCLEEAARLKHLHGKDSSTVAFLVSIQHKYITTILEDIQQNSESSLESSFSFSTIQSTGPSLFRKAITFGKFESSLTFNELVERFKKLVTRATDVAIFQEYRHKSLNSRESSPMVELDVPFKVADYSDYQSCSDYADVSSLNRAFERHLLRFMLQAYDLALKKGKKSDITSVMSQAKEVLRNQLSRLLVHLLSPSVGICQNMFVIEMFNQESQNLDILKLLININQVGLKLSCYIYELVVSNVNVLTRGQRNEINDFMDHMESLGVSVVHIGARLSSEEKDMMKMDMADWSKKVLQEKDGWLRIEGLAFQRVLRRMDGFSKKLSSQAMEVTQVVNNDQNQLRKKFIDHMKQQMSDRLQVKKMWQQLIAQLSHERGVWHSEKLYPHSWQLDPTEGPSRMRCKLMRCHLNMESRFLLPEYQKKLDSSKHDPPLSYLFQDEKLSLDSAAVIYKLYTSENIEYTCMCRSITPQTTTSGVLLVGQSFIYYVADEAIMEDNYTRALLGSCDDLFMTLPHDDILEFHKQWYLLKDEALEIFLSNGKTCLLALNSTKDRDELYAKLSSLDLVNVQPEDNLLHIQMQWLDGKMTNFEYLMNLNKMAGRSFNDLMQYPVFPFILSQYTNSSLELDEATSYRDLCKTISTQFKEQEEKYIQLYKMLKDQRSPSDPYDILLEPYHYTNHYSNVATVLQFLVRMPPFTQLFIDFQDKNFDCADRTFHSIQNSYNLVTKLSITDSKELIPEFFYLPEFLENNEGFDFGAKQNGQVVNNVELPLWSENDPRLFTLIHRQALESDHVTRTLASWIDLVFGYKQHGQAAIDAINVFRPSMYFGLNVDAIEDELTRKAVKTMIRTHGQTPKQLFKNPHPSPIIRHRSSSIKEKPSPLPQISGLRWGDYVGSPDCPNPLVVSCNNWKSDVISLVVLPTGEVFGLAARSSLLVKQKGMKSMQPTGFSWAAVLSWHHRDGIIRLQNRRGEQSAINFIHWNSANQVTCCTSLSNCRQIFFGTELGSIVVLNTKPNDSKSSNLQVFDHRLHLYGHSASVTCISVCQPFSILVSTSRDSTCILWDLNRLCYVRSIVDHKDSITALCISNNSGDIATVSNIGDGGSCLMLHSINAHFIASASCPEQIQCIAFSPGPEGQSVNIIVGGSITGKIRMWSSWDLSVVRDLTPSKSVSPILSLTYSLDGQSLFCLTHGQLTLWGNRPSSSRTKKFKFIPFL